MSFISEGESESESIMESFSKSSVSMLIRLSNVRRLSMALRANIQYFTIGRRCLDTYLERGFGIGGVAVVTILSASSLSPTSSLSGTISTIGVALRLFPNGSANYYSPVRMDLRRSLGHRPRRRSVFFVGIRHPPLPSRHSRSKQRKP